MEIKEYDEYESFYGVFEKIKEKWYLRNIFMEYKKAVDFIYKMKEWEERWKEHGFEYAPTPGIYKIVRFTEAETFTIEDYKRG